jgi:Arc/MetJ-type ribon-helix-helix transcriptional regulator
MLKYSTISVPKTLHEEIRRTVVEDPRVGYSSVAEFSKEAIRLRLDELKMELKSKDENLKELEDIIKKIKKAIKSR